MRFQLRRVQSSKNGHIQFEGSETLVKRGAIVHVFADRKEWSIKSLHDKSRGSVIVTHGNNNLTLSPGEEIKSTNAPQSHWRNKRNLAPDIIVQEFSMADFIANNRNMKSIRILSGASEMQLESRIEKTAVCIGIIRASQGPFKGN